MNALIAAHHVVKEFARLEVDAYYRIFSEGQTLIDREYISAFYPDSVPDFSIISVLT